MGRIFLLSNFSTATELTSLPTSGLEPVISDTQGMARRHADRHDRVGRHRPDHHAGSPSWVTMPVVTLAFSSWPRL